MAKLTPKQEKFCIEYLKDLNATQAAIRAGYSEDTAHNIGWENVRKREIRDVIDKELESAMSNSRTELKNKIIRELETIAFADITEDINIVTKEVKDEDGNIEKYQTVEMNDTKGSKQTRAIAGIKISDKGNIEVKYYDKIKAIDDLGKYLAMWTEKVEHNINSEAFEKLKELYANK